MICNCYLPVSFSNSRTKWSKISRANRSTCLKGVIDTSNSLYQLCYVDYAMSFKSTSQCLEVR